MPETVEAHLVKVHEVKEKHEKQLLQKPNVVGVAIGYKYVKGKETEELGVLTLVERKVEEKELAKDQMIPKSYEGVKTDVQEVGRIEAQTYNAHLRPARPGYSIGHYKITAGTFGCLARDKCPPCRVYILSNNHVLANSNAAAIGDPILQPGAYDAGAYPSDLIATLARFVPITFGNPNAYNLVDAALALPVDQRLVIASVVGLGIPTGTVEATLGMDVVKSGRTTQTTSGKVTGVDATVAVNYGVGVAYFRNQIITSNMSKGGDSGSLLLGKADRKAVGLLFAGSNVITIHNDIANVMMALGIEVIVA
ncbi:MAG: hypothetical protein AB2L11_11070 [Syntrophobacteraceae bacterium]